MMQRELSPPWFLYGLVPPPPHFNTKKSNSYRLVLRAWSWCWGRSSSPPRAAPWSWSSLVEHLARSTSKIFFYGFSGEDFHLINWCIVLQIFLFGKIFYTNQITRALNLFFILWKREMMYLQNKIFFFVWS